MHRDEGPRDGAHQGGAHRVEVRLDGVPRFAGRPQELRVGVRLYVAQDEARPVAAYLDWMRTGCYPDVAREVAAPRDEGHQGSALQDEARLDVERMPAAWSLAVQELQA